MKESYLGYLKQIVYTKLAVESRNVEAAEKYANKKALLGSDIEFWFQRKESEDLDNDHFLIMDLLGRFRSFALAENLVKAARRGEEVDKELIGGMTEAENVRAATIRQMGSEVQGSLGHVEETANAA